MLEIEVCKHCGMRVIARDDGSCPSCSQTPNAAELRHPYAPGARTAVDKSGMSPEQKKKAIWLMVIAVILIAIARLFAPAGIKPARWDDRGQDRRTNAKAARLR